MSMIIVNVWLNNHNELVQEVPTLIEFTLQKNKN